MELADPELTRLKVIVYITRIVDFYMSYYTRKISGGKNINIFLHLICLQKEDS